MQPEQTQLSIRNEIVLFVMTNFPSDYTAETLPQGQSLVELGVVDSFGVVELVAFLEGTWSIAIDDSEITRETMGSIDKMAALVQKKVAGTAR
jgi:acyl carrier protein